MLGDYGRLHQNKTRLGACGKARPFATVRYLAMLELLCFIRPYPGQIALSSCWPSRSSCRNPRATPEPRFLNPLGGLVHEYR